MQLSLLPISKNPRDVVYTPDEIARDIVKHFQPSGFCLDPCKGDGAFLRYLPAGSEWCEIREGRDFFAWDRPVDWIVSNPPYSIFYEWFLHSIAIAENIVYLIPSNKIFQSYRYWQELKKWGWVKEIYIVGKGTDINLPVGFAVAAIHFAKGYAGETKISLRQPNNHFVADRTSSAQNRKAGTTPATTCGG